MYRHQLPIKYSAHYTAASFFAQTDSNQSPSNAGILFVFCVAIERYLGVCEQNIN